MNENKNNENKNIVLFDTDNYTDEYYSEEYMIEDLRDTLETFTKKVRGEVVNWMLSAKRISMYGSICNNGAIGYLDLKHRNDLAESLLMANSTSDKIVVRDNDGEIQISYYDHDGEHQCSIKSVPKSKEAEYDNFYYKNYDQQLNFISKLSSLKTKKSAINQMK